MDILYGTQTHDDEMLSILSLFVQYNNLFNNNYKECKDYILYFPNISDRGGNTLT